MKSKFMTLNMCDFISMFEIDFDVHVKVEVTLACILLNFAGFLGKKSYVLRHVFFSLFNASILEGYMA